MSKPQLLEINTRCWLRELSEQAGRPVTLGNVPPARWKAWTESGFTHVWLMGVWTIGPKSRQHSLRSAELRAEYDRVLPGWKEEDVCGSPYSIMRYEVAAEFGGEAGLKSFRAKLNKAGLRLILDFVPNHLGLDHPWVTEQPELFVQSDGANDASFIGGSERFPIRLCHGRDPWFEPWRDTAQLDYRRADTRALMTAELLAVAGRCDGVRCDMAMLLLNEVIQQTWHQFPCRATVETAEFWPQAIQAVLEVQPGFEFIAEAYWDRERELLDQGFHFAYHKPVADAVFDRPETARTVARESRDWVGRGVHFLENHDEPRVAARLDPDAHRAAALLILALPGLTLIHEGQFNGARVKTSVHLGRRQREKPDPQIRSLYQTLRATLKQCAVGEGRVELLEGRPAWDENPTADFCFLIQWQARPDVFDLVVVNLAPHRSQCYAPLTISNLATHGWVLTDLLGDEHYLRDGEQLKADGLYLDVPAFAAQVFHFEPARHDRTPGS